LDHQSPALEAPEDERIQEFVNLGAVESLCHTIMFPMEHDSVNYESEQLATDITAASLVGLLG
jgi:hypothetical protein